MEDKMREFVRRSHDLEMGVIPFVEQGSLEEELAFNELFYIKKQIGVIAKTLARG